MRVLADENIPLPTVDALRRAGHDVTWARSDHSGAKDAVLLELAESDRRVLVTLDKDFWQIAIQRHQPLEQGGLILFRVHPSIPDAITPLVLRTLAMDQQWTGQASVVTEDRVLMVRSGRPAGATMSVPANSVRAPIVHLWQVAG